MKNKARLIWSIAGITLLSPLFSSGQDVHIPTPTNSAESVYDRTDKRMLVQHETLGDKYLPNAFNNKRTSPAYKYTNTRVSRAAGTSIYTVQVNVDSSGHNILGDAANEPNIAVNPLNENSIVIAWRQFDNVSSNFRQAGWSYTSNGGQSWTFPGVIQPGLFRSDPVLNFDIHGNFYYNSLQNDFTCQVFKSANGGVAWDNGTDAGGGDKQCMTIDHTSGVGSGNIYSSWTSQYSTCLPGFFTRSENEDSSYENCTIVNGYPYWATMAVGNAEELYIAGTDSNFNFVVAKSTNANTHGSSISWDSAVYVYMDGYLNGAQINPAGLLGQAYIDVDRSNGPGRGNVYVLASMTRISNGDPGDVMFAKSTDGGQTWSSPLQINDDSAAEGNYVHWFGTMSVAPNGRIDAVWLDNRDSKTGSDSSALYYSYSVDQGNTWSINERLSELFNPHVGYPNQNKMGDYFDMVSDNTGAHLAWANTFNGEEDVYYSYITPNIETGVNAVSDNATFSIFPNPAEKQFTIQDSQFMIEEIEIYNIVGAKVYSEILNLKSPISNHSIDISSQPAGIYFLKVAYHDGSSAVKKIIKE